MRFMHNATRGSGTTFGSGAARSQPLIFGISTAGGAVITLSNNNPGVASVPSSVTVAAGTSNTTFAIGTASVTSSTSVTISGAYGGVSRTATLTLTPAASADTVAVQRAEFSSGQLRVEAASTSSTATLT